MTPRETDGWARPSLESRAQSSCQTLSLPPLPPMTPVGREGEHLASSSPFWRGPPVDHKLAARCVFDADIGFGSSRYLTPAYGQTSAETKAAGRKSPKIYLGTWDDIFHFQRVTFRCYFGHELDLNQNITIFKKEMNRYLAVSFDVTFHPRGLFQA